MKKDEEVQNKETESRFESNSVQTYRERRQTFEDVRGAESEKDSTSILFINAKEKWIYQKLKNVLDKLINEDNKK